MDPSTTIAAVSVPLAAVPVGTSLAGVFKSLRPQTRVEKWSQRIDDVIALVSERHSLVPARVMESFLETIDEYITKKEAYERKIENGSCTWYGRGRQHGEKFVEAARGVWRGGKTVSTQAMLAQQRCQLYHQNLPRNSQGKCATCFPPELEFPRLDGSQFSKQYSIAVWSAIMKSILSKSAAGQLTHTSSNQLRFSESRVPLIAHNDLGSIPRSSLESMPSVIDSIDIAEQSIPNLEEVVDEVGNKLVQLMDVAVQRTAPTGIEASPSDVGSVLK